MYYSCMEIDDGKKIFVSIPAFNEMFLEQTVEDLFRKADIPERVFVGIFNQKSNDKTFEDFSRFKNVRVMNVHCDIPTGIGMAKLNATSLHNGEEYFLQIDAHSLFAKGWDSVLVNDFNKLKENGIDKPIISQSVMWHAVDVYDTEEYKNKDFTDTAYPLTLNERGDTTVNRDFKWESSELFLDKFIEHYCIIGPFMFTSSSFIYEVSYDFRITYAVEQESIAMRAYTRGYRIFSNGVNVVSTLTKRRQVNGENIFDSDAFPDDLQNDLVPGAEIKYEKLAFHRISNKIFFETLRGGYLGWFGSPTKELHSEYIKKLGFDFFSVGNFENDETNCYPKYLNKSIY